MCRAAGRRAVRRVRLHARVNANRMPSFREKMRSRCDQIPRLLVCQEICRPTRAVGNDRGGSACRHGFGDFGRTLENRAFCTVFCALTVHLADYRSRKPGSRLSFVPGIDVAKSRSPADSAAVWRQSAGGWRRSMIAPGRTNTKHCCQVFVLSRYCSASTIALQDQPARFQCSFRGFQPKRCNSCREFSANGALENRAMTGDPATKASARSLKDPLYSN